MEHEFFRWQNWDGDEENKVFYNCTLKMDIGQFKTGAFIPVIGWLCTDRKFLMEFLDNDGNALAVFPLKVVLA